MSNNLVRALAAVGFSSIVAAFAHAAEPVRIGVLTDMAGVYASVAGKGVIAAAEMAVEDFRKAHPEQPVELLTADHQNKPDIASTIARKWFDVEGVHAIAELTTSAIALSVQKLAAEHNRVVLVSGAGSSDLTGKACSPTGFHWTYDTYALANGTARAIVGQGGDEWFFLTVDYAFGHALEKDVTDTVKALGGKVVGSVKHPLGTSDFASYLLQAQASGAKVIGLANAGADLHNSIKQANEFGIDRNQRVAALLVYINDVHAMGLDKAKNVQLTTGFYWDRNEKTRNWSKRFFERVNVMPNMAQAGVYSSIRHYLEAAIKADPMNGKAVSRAMKNTPVNDFFAENGVVREDGRMVHDMFLVRVKEPSESKYPWDYYEVISTIAGKDAFRKMEGGGCPLVKP